MYLYAVLILLAGALVWSEISRRKTKETLLGSTSNSTDGETIEVRREIDPATQTETQILSEVFDVEKELRSLAEQRKKYNEGIGVSSTVSGGSNSNMSNELNLDKYVDAF